MFHTLHTKIPLFKNCSKLNLARYVIAMPTHNTTKELKSHPHDVPETEKGNQNILP